MNHRKRIHFLRGVVCLLAAALLSLSLLACSDQVYDPTQGTLILNEGTEITPEQLKLTGLVDDTAENYDGPAGRITPAQPYKRKEDIAREMGISRTTLWRRAKKMKQNET